MALQMDSDAKVADSSVDDLPTDEAVTRYICVNKSLPFEVSKIVTFASSNKIANVEYTKVSELLRLYVQSVVNYYQTKNQELNVSDDSIPKEKCNSNVDYSSSSKVLHEYVLYLRKHEECPSVFDSFSDDKIAATFFDLHVFVVRQWLYQSLITPHPTEMTVNNNKDDPISTLIQNLLNKLPQIINKVLSAAIKPNYDPAKLFWTKSGSFGGHFVGATYSLQLDTLSGLSSLSIDSFTNTKVSHEVNSFQGTTTMNSSTHELHLTVNGTATTRLLVPIHSKFKGKITCSQIHITSAGSVAGIIASNPLKGTLNNLSLSNLHFGIGKVKVSISGLGPLNYILDALIDIIIASVKNDVAHTIAPIIQNIVNDSIHKKLPIST